MLLCEFKLSYAECEIKENAAAAVIVAAGSSSRMNGVNKQFLEIGGMPVIARTLTAFENSPYIKKIIIVCRDFDILKMQEICQKYLFLKVTDIVEGGNSRQESVLCGFKRLIDADKSVVIHDGARPFVTDKMIEESVVALESFDAALCCVKVVDTVKRSADGETADGTVNRDGLYLAQTPQSVNKDKYIEAVKRCENMSKMTDDASIMENAGMRVKIVNGSRKNIKITTEDDIELARIFAGEADL